MRVGKGVDRSLVGTLHRPDGSTQLSYGGHPLYTYNGDVSPGVVMGQAIDQDGGLWYVLNAQGKQITTCVQRHPVERQRQRGRLTGCDDGSGLREARRARA